MHSDRSIKATLQRALRDQIQCKTDAKGYVRTPAENLVDGVTMEQFEDDVRSGSGDELRTKFCATHSSTALAVNCFAWFKSADRLQSLSLLDAMGASALRFERKFRIFDERMPPNLDVWIEREHENIAIESKLTEYFEKKRPKFSRAYDRLAPPELAEPCWWQVYQRAKESEPRYLDIAQLVKHYFGLRRYQQSTECAKPLVFLYLYWEPLNWQDIHSCNEHRREVEQLACDVEESEISFKFTTYTQLWHAWSEIPELAQHAENLKARYEVRL